MTLKVVYMTERGERGLLQLVVFWFAIFTTRWNEGFPSLSKISPSPLLLHLFGIHKQTHTGTCRFCRIRTATAAFLEKAQSCCFFSNCLLHDYLQTILSYWFSDNYYSYWWIWSWTNWYVFQAISHNFKWRRTSTGSWFISVFIQLFVQAQIKKLV